MTCQYHSREENEEKPIGDSPLLRHEHRPTTKKSSYR